jgi:hypothetical protein
VFADIVAYFKRRRVFTLVETSVLASRLSTIEALMMAFPLPRLPTLSAEVVVVRLST